MSYTVRFTPSAREDLRRLFALLVVCDVPLAQRARDALGRGMLLLQTSPFACRALTADAPHLRTLVIGFDASGYIALFEIDGDAGVTVLAVRQQREDDFRH